MLSNAGINVDKLSERWVPYVIGQRPNIIVAMDWTDFDADNQATSSASAEGETRPAEDWVGSGGRPRTLRNAFVTADSYQVGSVVCVHAKDMKEPWCLAASTSSETDRLWLLNAFAVVLLTLEPQARLSDMTVISNQTPPKSERIRCFVREPCSTNFTRLPCASVASRWTRITKSVRLGG
jgi:hypothetical protein